jgi:hypothetical protein
MSAMFMVKGRSLLVTNQSPHGSITEGGTEEVNQGMVQCVRNCHQVEDRVKGVRIETVKE